MPTPIIYTQPTCGYCQELKDYLKKNNIPYEEKDITKDRAAWDAGCRFDHPNPEYR